MLGDYQGTVLVVSHDRDFLDRVATSVVVAEGEGRWIEYAGGYSDMVAQRGFGVTKPEALRAEKAGRGVTATFAGVGALQRGKLSFKHKHALETLPGEIERLAAEIARLNAMLADPAFYARDAKGFADASRRLVSAQSERAAAEDQWLDLETRREEIEG
jgi:ATP-binding cassette subfamily F protein uup